MTLKLPKLSDERGEDEAYAPPKQHTILTHSLFAALAKTALRPLSLASLTQPPAIRRATHSPRPLGNALSRAAPPPTTWR
eukprot:1016701-Pyramimonas_sp.AAC.1